MLSKLFTISAALSVASAAPTLQARGVGTTFALITTVTDAPAPVALLNKGIWALRSNADGYATLVDRSQGALFYEYTNSTSNDPSVAVGSSGIVITPGGTATVPSANKVALVENQATSNVFIAENSSGIPILEFEYSGSDGSFQACTAETLGAEGPNTSDGDIVLGFVQSGQRPYADCVIVDLISNCVGAGSQQGSDGVGALGAPINVRCQPN